MKIAVFGTGLSSYGCIKGLLDKGFLPDVYDIGEEEKKNTKKLLKKLGKKKIDNWSKNDHKIMENLSSNKKNKFRKFFLNDDYVYKDYFKDKLNLENNIVYSNAKGGFSNVWSASAFPLNSIFLNKWDKRATPTREDYKKIIDSVPYFEGKNNFKKFFYSFKKENNIRKTSNISNYIFENLNKINNNNFFSGQTSCFVNFEKKNNHNCQYCGYCYTGCVYNSIFNSKFEIEKFEKFKKIKFFNNFELNNFYEEKNKVFLSVFHNKKIKILTYDKVFIAIGAFKSTKVLANSLNIKNKGIKLNFAPSFIVPGFFNNKSGIELKQNTLPSNSFLLKSKSKIIYGHFSEINEIILNFFKYYKFGNFYKKIINFILKKFFFIQLQCGFEKNFYYFIYFDKKSDVKFIQKSFDYKKRINAILKILNKQFRKINFYLLKNLIQVPSLKDNYYLGCSFPMSKKKNKFKTDYNGRPYGFQNVHIVDSSIFQSIPSVGFGFLLMANSYRIVRETFKKNKSF